jgi:hypothetical protein
MKKLVYCAVAAAALAVGISSAVVAANSGKPSAEGLPPHTRNSGSGTAAFPSSTTIYIIPGVVDDGGALDVGIATSVTCTNVSGVPVNIRVAAFQSDGVKKGDHTLVGVPNTGVRTFSTHLTNVYADDSVLGTSVLSQGVFNVEATNAAVFCTATVEDAASNSPSGWDLHVIRVNAAPGTVE